MIVELTNVIREQRSALNELLEKLDEQYKLIMKKDIFGLEGIVEEIQLCNKKVAEHEVARRKLTGNNSIRMIVDDSGSDELDREYREIQKILHMITLQKETNDVLIKQGLSYTNRMLAIINPKRENGVYNSYGQINR
ncbi:MAG: flagellar protein FlgN [Clostridium sp.]